MRRDELDELLEPIRARIAELPEAERAAASDAVGDMVARRLIAAAVFGESAFRKIMPVVAVDPPPDTG